MRSWCSMARKGVIFPVGASGAWDDTSTSCGCPCVLYHGNHVYLYYSGTTEGTYFRTGLAISKDGVNFVKKGAVVVFGAAGQIDTREIRDPSVIYKDNHFWMYYRAKTDSGGYNYGLALAISKDGVNFVKKGIVLPLGASGATDDAAMAVPSVVYNHGHVWLYYAASPNGSLHYCSLAVSKDGVNFVKKGVAVTIGSSSEMDATTVWGGRVLVYNNWFLNWYHGVYWSSGYYDRIFFAVSKDGMNFVKKGVSVPFGASGNWDDGAIYEGGAMIKDGYFWLYRSSNDQITSKIGLDCYPVQQYFQ